MAGVDAPAPIDILVVSSWFPSVDDPGKGRFVADQVEAIAATGMMRPAVVSFDPVRLTGVPAGRDAQADAVLREAVGDIDRASSPFIRPTWGVRPELLVARLVVPEGANPSAGPAHGAKHRSAVLRALGSRLRASPSSVGEAAGIVHAHTGYPDGAAAIALADALQWPLIVTEHASFVGRLISDPAIRVCYEAVLERADRLFAVSEMLAGELRAAFPAYAARIDVLPNAVRVDEFTLVPAASRRQDELLFVGYRKASKGIATLLHGVAAARAVRPSISLRLVGGGTPEEDAGWRALARKLGIADAVTFDPATDRAGVVVAMGRASVFVHASPRETFGVVVAEALACGTPVVATDSGGVTEILGPDPDRYGAIVPIEDPAAFGAAIVRTLDRRAAFDPEALRSSVEQRFGADRIAERLRSVYGEALVRWQSIRPGQAGSTKPETDSTNFESGRDPLFANVLLESRDEAEATRLIVVALDPASAARRLGTLPDELRARVTLLTSRTPSDAHLPSVGRLVTIQIDPGWKQPRRTGLAGRPGWLGRLVRLGTHPVATVRHRLRPAEASVAWLPPATAALSRLVAEHRGLPVEVIGVDGHDVLLVSLADAAQGGLRSDGGLRRLADRWIGESQGNEPGR